MKKECVETFNSLLRGERSALETYEKALATLDEGPHRIRLEQICAGHRERVADLEQHILSLGGSPEKGSGAWGVVASVVQTVANVMGDKTAVYSLKEGEEHGLRSYQSSLEHVADQPACVKLINSCISAQQANVSTLESML
jgi:hypothetical protein